MNPVSTPLNMTETELMAWWLSPTGDEERDAARITVWNKWAAIKMDGPMQVGKTLLGDGVEVWLVVRTWATDGETTVNMYQPSRIDGPFVAVVVGLDKMEAPNAK